MKANKKRFDQLIFSKKAGPTANEPQFGMREFLGTSVKKIATYETGSN